MKKRTLFYVWIVTLTVVFSMAFMPQESRAEYPTKPVSFLIPFGVGGSADLSPSNNTRFPGAEAFQNIVIKAFRNDHLAARTPSPCTTCNPLLKWQLLFDKADQENANFVASGHYIQKEYKQGIWYLKKGADKLKDQSYYLWGLDQEKVKRIITPLGVSTKVQVKELANKIGLEFLSNQKAILLPRLY